MSIRAIPEEIYVKFAIIFVGHGQLVKHHALWWRQRKQIWGNFFCFFLKYKISRSVNNKAMVHQNTIFKNYFSICWGFFFFRKMRIYRIQHAFILAVKELTFSVNCWMQITSFVLLRRTLFGRNEEKKTHLRERKFLTPLLSRRPLLFQSNINFKVIVHAVMGKQRGIVTLCYYIEPSQYGSMNYSSNGQIIYIV